MQQIYCAKDSQNRWNDFDFLQYQQGKHKCHPRQKTVCIWGRPYIEDTIHLLSYPDFTPQGTGITYQISPQSFYQVNPKQTEKLYSTALAFAGLTGNENVWDLYCGIGTISLFLSQKAKQVYGVEIVPQAIEDAKTMRSSMASQMRSFS